MGEETLSYGATRGKNVLVHACRGGNDPVIAAGQTRAGTTAKKTRQTSSYYAMQRTNRPAKPVPMPTTSHP